ncbi:hypothetical protein CIL05_08445 [Virgibacillus profundi]|uniref:tRNA(Met) cytidine acetate ligase n=1 Tax=Virgibacillus profundi TaxID=2024555 RepID=A0A2A2IEW2_9BACI|nr:nucleotidyltransferase [Virgibacillus profundi]PAV29898.1 hypothetical protein CIL05_08445 [Virgibacillus profundi]PXY54070.1 nucleotidyltransferase [Virgibacillus profundi]
MNACGLIVEYNPFHNGHVHHIQEAKKTSGADCMIAVMSGDFLQRGEPAIIDKFHRVPAALQSGIDIVLELPYPYAVQSSDLFAKGSVQTLHEVGVSSICFGSESGDISHFITSYEIFKEKEAIYRKTLKTHLAKGISFPEASKYAYRQLGLSTPEMDLAKPNNILGFSYIKAILEKKLPIQPLTIQRTNSGYHQQTITGSIASATSIRKQLFKERTITEQVLKTMPDETIKQLKDYMNTAETWHMWEKYFQIIHYRVMTMTTQELAEVHGVDEGLEYRIKKTAKKAISFNDWVGRVKTKRYTWTRIQRIFVHILTNTKKSDMKMVESASTVPYVRLLGMTKTGQAYLNNRKKNMDVPLVSSLGRNNSPMLQLEEKAANAYYSILSPRNRQQLFMQELQAPIIFND